VRASSKSVSEIWVWSGAVVVVGTWRGTSLAVTVISGVRCDDDGTYDDCGRETTLSTADRQAMVSKRWLLVDMARTREGSVRAWLPRSRLIAK